MPAQRAGHAVLFVPKLLPVIHFTRCRHPLLAHPHSMKSQRRRPDATHRGAGSIRAYGSLRALWQPGLRPDARVLRDSRLAEEASQDTFLKVWNKSVQWDPAKGQLDSWLLTIARYAAIDRLRCEQGTTQPAPHFWMLYPTRHRVQPSSATAGGWTDSCSAS